MILNVNTYCKLTTKPGFKPHWGLSFFLKQAQVQTQPLAFFSPTVLCTGSNPTRGFLFFFSSRHRFKPHRWLFFSFFLQLFYAQVQTPLQAFFFFLSRHRFKPHHWLFLFSPTVLGTGSNPTGGFHFFFSSRHRFKPHRWLFFFFLRLYYAQVQTPLQAFFFFLKQALVQTPPLAFFFFSLTELCTGSNPTGAFFFFSQAGTGSNPTVVFFFFFSPTVLGTGSNPLEAFFFFPSRHRFKPHWGLSFFFLKQAQVQTPPLAFFLFFLRLY